MAGAPPPPMGSVQEVLAGIEGIEFVYFTEQDVVRHRLVQQVIKAYDRYEVKRAEATQSSRRQATSPTGRAPTRRA